MVRRETDNKKSAHPPILTSHAQKLSDVLKNDEQQIKHHQTKNKIFPLTRFKPDTWKKFNGITMACPSAINDRGDNLVNAVTLS